MRKPRRTEPLRAAPAAAWRLGVLLWLATAAAPAAADERVAAVADADLPAVGLCAPLAAEPRTVVRAGTPVDSRWFAVDGVPGVLDAAGLEALLAERAGVAPGGGRASRHPVWIRVSGRHRWEHVVRVVSACLRTGIYRVGLEVRHPVRPGVFGFPLFLPGDLPGVPVPEGRAVGLEVRVGTALEGEPGAPSAPSDPGRLYAAARRLAERHPQRVVVSLRVAHNAPVQYALTCLDMLYRGGVAGVKLRIPMLKGRLDIPVTPWVMVESLMLDPDPLGVEVPRQPPRTEPWPDWGANVPGVLLMPTEDLPTAGGAEAAAGAGRDEWPAHGGGPVPRGLRQRAALTATNYGSGLATALQAGLRGGPEAVAYLAERLRPLAEFTEAMRPAREAFPDATHAVPNALMVDVLLYRAGRGVAHLEATLELTGDEPDFVFLRVGRGEGGGVAPAPQEDPSRTGVAGALRVLLEAALADLGTRGSEALALAPAEQVLAWLPPVAHAAVAPALARRPAELEAVVRMVRATPFDQVVVRPVSGSLSVRSGERVVGVLNLGLTTERGELRVAGLGPRRAPR